MRSKLLYWDGVRMITFFKLACIERRLLTDLKLGLGACDMRDAADIAKQLMDGAPASDKMAKRLYGSDSSHALERVERFGDIAKSIQEHGYLTFLDMSVADRNEIFDACDRSDSIPRVHNGNNIDDGKHRCAALLANDEREVLVAYCAIIKIPEDDLAHMELELNQQIRLAVHEFLEEEKKWL